MKKVFSLLLVILLSNWAVAQITDYSIFDKKFNFYVANDLGRNGYYDQKPMWNSYERSFIIEYQLYRKITVQKSY